MCLRVLSTSALSRHGAAPVLTGTHHVTAASFDRIASRSEPNGPPRKALDYLVDINVLGMDACSLQR